MASSKDAEHESKDDQSLSDGEDLVEDFSFLPRLRQLMVFQLKLAADALRDFVLSPLSIAAFVIDAVLQSPAEESLYERLMGVGRRSDRVINLFDEHTKGDGFTVDKAVDTIEEAVRATQSDRSEFGDPDDPRAASGD
ncbi:MAG: hypothetical protein AAF671_09135 [Pseudomonadota bacterium]